MEEKVMPIEERLDVLKEFADFYSKQPADFCFPKRTALFSLVQLFEFAKEEEGELTEEKVDEILTGAIGGMDTDAFAKKHKMSALDKDFLEGGFGLGIGVMRGDREAIKNHYSMMEKIDKMGIIKSAIAKEENDKLLEDVMEDIKNVER